MTPERRVASPKAAGCRKPACSVRRGKAAGRSRGEEGLRRGTEAPPPASRPSEFQKASVLTVKSKTIQKQRGEEKTHTRGSITQSRRRKDREKKKHTRGGGEKTVPDGAPERCAGRSRSMRRLGRAGARAHACACAHRCAAVCADAAETRRAHVRVSTYPRHTRMSRVCIQMQRGPGRSKKKNKIKKSRCGTDEGSMS